MNFSIIFDNYPLILKGLWTTIHMVGLSLILGFLLSIPLSVIRHLKIPILNQVVWGYTYFFRGTPLLLQMYLIYYGLAQFEIIRESWMWYFLKEAYFCGLFAFVLNTAAYTSEIIHGSLNTMDKREMEATRAFGMTEFQTYTRVVIPNALRRSIPSYSNEVIYMIHGSAIAGVITIVDLTGAGSYLYSKYYDPFTPYIAVGAVYLCLVFTVLYGFRKLEKHYMSYLKHSR